MVRTGGKQACHCTQPHMYSLPSKVYMLLRPPGHR